MWAAIDELSLPPRPAESQGISPTQLAAFAVEHHPALLRARSELGGTEALIVEAGLWPGLEIGWGGMDALASEIAEDHTKSVDYLSGLDLSADVAGRSDDVPLVCDAEDERRGSGGCPSMSTSTLHRSPNELLRCDEMA